MFLTIELHNFPQVFSNQIMHLFYMLYAYVSIAQIVYVWPYMCCCVCEFCFFIIQFSLSYLVVRM